MKTGPELAARSRDASRPRPRGAAGSIGAGALAFALLCAGAPGPTGARADSTVPAPGASATRPPLDEAALADIGRRLGEASRRQQQAVATAFTGSPPAACVDKVAGMIRDPMACIQARSQGHAAAATSEQGTILSLLAEAEASLDSDLAALPAGQIQRYRAMETLNEKYESIVRFTRATARAARTASTDAPVRAACERFESKRLAATQGQEAVPADGGKRRARLKNKPPSDAPPAQ